MAFETEKKANTFLKFNKEAIESESGFGPSRSYYCIYCNAWHVTSKNEPFAGPSKTEVYLEQYRQMKEQRSLARAEQAEKRRMRIEELNGCFESIEKKIEVLEASLETGNLEKGVEIATLACAELERVKLLKGQSKKKQLLESKLILIMDKLKNNE